MTLESGNHVLFFKNSFLLSFCSYSISISSIVSPIINIACSKTLLWFKALCPIFDSVENDSLLYFSMVCDFSFWTLECFIIISTNSATYLDEKACSIRIFP